MQEWGVLVLHITPVYASPNEDNRKTMWDDLRIIANNMREAWLLAGDFNDIACMEEKRGGVSASLRRCNKFSERINACNLMDMGAMGPKFTWRGPIYHGGQRIYERLDRALCNEKWRTNFPDGSVKVLTRVAFSDHHPLLISPLDDTYIRAPRQFRFESAWLLDNTYQAMLAESWRRELSVPHNLDNVQRGITNWKLQTFDQVKRKKKEIMARLAGIQNRMYHGNNSGGLKRLEYKLQAELNNILEKEELMWFQRSRAKWLIDGDRNTRYYHTKTISRRRRNNILMLKNDHGEWIEDVEQLQRMAKEFFQNLFSNTHARHEWKQTDISYPAIDSDTMTKLAVPFTNDEVKRALFAMQPWKAPGPDGFPAGFYQKAWGTVGGSVCEFVCGVWDNPSVVSSVNQTDICLIPKIQQPEFITQFRPISLCNTIYKIVSKVIVERLKDCIPKLVSPFQTGFVPGRIIHENVIVAKEMAHSMHRMKGRKGAFAIKVDLSKAYDKISWECIWRVLCETSLPSNLVNIIMLAVTSVETNVKWNGARSEYFRPQRGIRQGDPISPYIFVLCMDKLSHLILHEVNIGKWRGIKAGRNGPMVSHLMFADDLLLFGEAKEEQMQCVINTLNNFCNLSGQEVSQEKTSIYFSKNASREIRNKLLRISGFKETSSLGRYLGVPLLGRAPKRNDFQYLVDQVETKLSGWKAKQLSFAGRVTLAKSVLEAIPIYPMMTTKIPKSCLNDIQRIQRNFIWGDSESGRKFHAVSWEKVTTPKWMGGLGLRNMEYMNQACLIKLGWKLFSGADDYWCQILR
ncbi:ribonuclease H, partial [Trifolium pratense]